MNTRLAANADVPGYVALTIMLACEACVRLSIEGVSDWNEASCTMAFDEPKEPNIARTAHGISQSVRREKGKDEGISAARKNLSRNPTIAFSANDVSVRTAAVYWRYCCQRCVSRARQAHHIQQYKALKLTRAKVSRTPRVVND